MFGKLFGRNSNDDWRQIRKDARDLTIADFDRFLAWEFCLDEEGLEGQDECTVRPYVASGRIEPTLFGGMIAADVRQADGTRRFGILSPSSTYLGGDPYTGELWLAKPAGQYGVSGLPTGCSYIIHAESDRIAFDLGMEKHFPTTAVRAQIEQVYRVLGTTKEQMWPLTFTPRLAVNGWPTTIQLHGWRRVVSKETLI